MLIAQIAFETLAVTTAMPTVARSLDGLSLYAVAFGVTFATSMIGMVIQLIRALGPINPQLLTSGLIKTKFRPLSLSGRRH